MAKTSASTRPEFTDPVAAYLAATPASGAVTDHLRTGILWKYFFLEDEFKHQLALGLTRGKERADAPQDLIAINFPQGSSLQALFLFRRGYMNPSGEFLAMSPECAGAVSLLKLLSTDEMEDGTSEITAECNGFKLTFTDPYFARNFPWYRRGKKYYFALYGIALNCSVAASKDRGALRPYAFTSCHACRGRVLAVKPGNFLDVKLTHVLTQINLDEARTVSLPVNLCASKYALSGYEPHEQDEISLNVCLLGHLVTKEPPRADGGIALFDGTDFSAF